MKLKKRVTKTTTIEQSLHLSADDIVTLLRRAGDIPENQTVDSVTVYVPGGGDWSNTSLDIDDETPVIVELRTEETVESSDD